MSSLRATLQVATGAVLISFSPVFVLWGGVSPAAAGVYRTLTGGGVLLGLCLFRRERLSLDGPALAWASLAGAFFAGDLTLWHRAIGHLGAGPATILANFQVFFMALAGVLWFGERLGLMRLLAIPVAVGGLAFLVGGDPTPSRILRLGVVFGLGAALAYTGYMLSLRRCRETARQASAQATLAVASLLSAALLSLEWGLSGGEGVPQSPGGLAALGAYGVVCHAGGWLFISHGISGLPPSRVGLLLLLQPTLAFVWDLVLFARPATLSQLLGAAIAVAAIGFGQRPPRTEPNRNGASPPA